MMDLTSNPQEILTLPLSTSETNTRSRKLNGCHLYISRWHRSFKLLHRDEQVQIRNEIIGGGGIENVMLHCLSSDEESLDSTDSRIDAPITAHDRMKLAWISWRSLPQLSKISWKQRSISLNRRPIPGILTQPPNQYSMLSFYSSVFRSMAIEWEQIVGIFRRMILFPRPRNDLLTKSYKFGTENVVVGNQIYRCFRLSHLIVLTLFGPEFSKVEKYCLISRTKKVCIIHIDTIKTMKRLFTIADECAVEYKNCKNGYESVQSCCGKVRVEKDGKSICGYLIDENEDGDKWNVHLLNNEQILVNKVKYDASNGCYVYDSNEESGEYRITHYNPVRLYIAMGKAQSKVILNRVGFDQSNNIVLNYSS